MQDKQLISTPTYGTSKRYLGTLGQNYFNQQSQLSDLATRWNFHLWQPYFSGQEDILDFGCGNGSLLAYLPGRAKIGVEINPAAQQQAASRGLEIYTSLDEVLGKGLTFSRIISNHALEHIPNPYGVLNSLHSLLQPNGRLILVLPLDDWRLSTQCQYRANNLHNHLYTWTPQSLGNLLVEAQFNPVQVRVITDCFPPRGVSLFLKLPFMLRSSIGSLCSRVLKRRQLMAVATK